MLAVELEVKGDRGATDFCDGDMEADLERPRAAPHEEVTDLLRRFELIEDRPRPSRAARHPGPRRLRAIDDALEVGLEEIVEHAADAEELREVADGEIHRAPRIEGIASGEEMVALLEDLGAIAPLELAARAGNHGDFRLSSDLADQILDDGRKRVRLVLERLENFPDARVREPVDGIDAALTGPTARS